MYIDFTTINKPSIDEVFLIVEDMPVFPENSDKSLKRTFSDFRDYIKSETYYPLMASRRKIQTSVFVQFTIGPDGKIYDSEARIYFTGF
jgi:hypothetical protein